MQHAEKLIARILLLEGQPTVSELGKIVIDSNVEEQLKNDCDAEESVIAAYNRDVCLATEVGDGGTHGMLKSILTDEEEHLDWIETQLDRIKQMGVQNCLATQSSQDLTSSLVRSLE